MNRRPLSLILISLLAALPSLALAAGATFPSPEAAVSALVAASRAGDRDRVLAIFGKDATDILTSGDEVADRSVRERFVAMYDESHRLVQFGLDRAELTVGREEWPFPIPVVHEGSSWRFDTAAGREEIIDRRIGRNELNTIDTLEAIVHAQHVYFRRNPMRGTPRFAARLLSNAGQRDGLYWPAAAGETPSPLAALASSAEAEGYSTTPTGGEPRPFHGYCYRVLNADSNGFMVLAYPAKYGVSGIVSFVVDDEGTFYERDLGAESDKVAPAIRTFDPVAWGARP